jgi:hypothetical protein
MGCGCGKKNMTVQSLQDTIDKVVESTKQATLTASGNADSAKTETKSSTSVTEAARVRPPGVK